jgi:hypothetical protein
LRTPNRIPHAIIQAMPRGAGLIALVSAAGVRLSLGWVTALHGRGA